MDDVLGYVVVEWNPEERQSDRDFASVLYESLELANEAVQLLEADARSNGRGQWYTVHAVMAEEIEEGS